MKETINQAVAEATKGMNIEGGNGVWHVNPGRWHERILLVSPSEILPGQFAVTIEAGSYERSALVPEAELPETVSRLVGRP